jgi:hypothetical protein
MNRLYALFLLVVFISTSIIAQQDLSEYMVIIQSDAGTGSGFICNINGINYIITNTHVMERSQRYDFKTVNHGLLKPVKLELADDRDLARIQIDNPDLPGLTLATAYPRINQPIKVYGNSQGASVITEISGKILGVGPSEIEVDAPFVSGNSGSPILSKENNILGVATYVTRPGMTNWVTADTRFSKTRRFGTRLTSDINWIPSSPRRLYIESSALADFDTFLVDTGDIYKGLVENKYKLIDHVSLRQGGRSPRYYNGSYSAVIKSFCDNYMTAVAHYSRGKSVRSFSVTSSLRNADAGFKNLSKFPLKEYRRMNWSTEYYRQIAAEYYRIFLEIDE